MIKHISIKNFKSLGDVSLDLVPVTVLIGRSGTGKSNFVEAIRFLRDYLTNSQAAQQQDWTRVMSATAKQPMELLFHLTFGAPGMEEDFRYELKLQQPHAQQAPQLNEEKLTLGSRVLFHQQQSKWIQQPPLVNPPPAGRVMMGALTGLQEVTIAHLVLTSGIGCHAFPDDVLAQANYSQGQGAGFFDRGENFLQVFLAINVNLQTWHYLREIAASLRTLSPSLKSIDLEMPQKNRIVSTHEIGNGHLLTFDLHQESEGFRRLLACLLALYQTPPKQTLLFEEPEKGLHPGGLAVLAEEFKTFASKREGQIVLTTHSPGLLDLFDPDQLRVVEISNHVTRIGPVAPEQIEALHEQLLTTGDLLTVDPARIQTVETALP
jgi:predicted ATPase